MEWVLGEREGAKLGPVCVTQPTLLSHSWGPQHRPLDGAPRGRYHQCVRYHHLPAAAHASQVPLYLQPEGPVQSLPGHAYG